MNKIIFMLFLIVAIPCYGTQQYSRYSIIIGKNEGGHGRPTLRYATTDAISISDLLEEFGGVKTENNILLLEPDKKTILLNLKKLKTNINNDKKKGSHVEFFFYYSGHSDEKGLLLKNETLLYKSIKKIVQDFASDINVVILDSCSSGSITRMKGGKAKAPFMIDESSKLKGYAFLTSSSSMEASQESEAVKGSYFSHYLASALRGAADNNSDDKVTLNEAYQYVFNETLAITENTEHGAQHPSYDIQIKGSGELVMTDLRKTSEKLIIDKKINGKMFLRDSRGFLIAEVNKQAGKQMELALAPEKYSITLVNEDKNKITDIIINKNKTYFLALNQFSSVISEQTTARGPAINKSKSMSVLSAGLSLDEKIFSNIFIKGAYKYFYGIFNFGIGIADAHIYTTGLGAGVRLPVYKFLINGDILYSKVSNSISHGDGELLQFRLIPSYQLSNLIGLHLGGTINVYTKKNYNTSNIIVRQGRGYRAGVIIGIEFSIL